MAAHWHSFYVQLTGPVLVPFNVEKQTAVLSALARNFPRLAFGFGLEQARINHVFNDAARATVELTISIACNTADAQLLTEVRRPVSPMVSATHLHPSDLTSYNIGELRSC